MAIHFIDQILIESGGFEFIDVNPERDEEGRPVLNPEDKIRTAAGSVYTVGELTDPSASDSFSPCDFANAIVDRNQPLNTKWMYPQLERKQVEWKERKAFREAIEAIFDSPEPIKGLVAFLAVHAVKNELLKEIEFLKVLSAALSSGAAWAVGTTMVNSLTKRSRPKPVIDFLK